MKIEKLLTQIKSQIAHDSHLSLGSHPVLQVSSTAVLLIIGQAPGIKVHKTGIPWNDLSGNRLRSWLAISKNEFYDKSKVATMSMSFCYPGTNKYGGDNPPNIEHAKLWHKPLRALMPNIKLTLLVGYYAQKYYLGKRIKASMTETVSSWREYLPEFIVLPHPSWHNNLWLKRHKWFEEELIPILRKKARELLH